MAQAIGIRVKRAPEGYDLGAGKFFGTPTIPEEWLDTFDDDEIFLCQIRLRDVAALDTAHRLPHKGYLYVFLHTAEGPYRLRADVRYYGGEPQVAVEAFNAAVEEYAAYDTAWLMEFAAVEEDYDGTKLFGLPSDWNYEDAPPPLLLQFDPLDGEMGFLDHLDGYLYFFFGEDPADFGAVLLTETYS